MRAIAALRALPVMAVVFTLILIAQGQANENAGQSLNVVKVVSPGGIEAWLVSDHINPIINVRFAFKGGASLDPEGKEGLAKIGRASCRERV